MATKPTIVFIPGFWHTPEGFTPLSKLLQEAGYPTILFSLPSAGAHPGHPDFSQDVSAIRSTILSLADAGKDVVLFTHSGGGVCGSEAARGLSKKERGGNGGVVKLVYIGILLPKAGKSLFETFGETVQSPDLDPGFVVDTDLSYHVIAEDGTSTITDGASRFYNGLSDEDAKYWASKLTSLSFGAAASPLTYEAWKYIPSAYIVCLQDKSVPLKQIRQKVKEAGIESVLEIDTGHAPYLVQPKTVAEFIRKVAGENI